MAISRDNKKLIVLGEFLFAHTWRCLVRSLWLFFPPFLFLLIAYFTFWHVTQGKDLMVITLEDPKGKSTLVEFGCFVVALIFWVYVTWYSTRIVSKAKHFQYPDDNDNIWEIFRVQTPRVLAFSCLTIILLAFFQLDNYNYPHLYSWECHLLLLFSYVYYYYINKFWTSILSQRARSSVEWLKYLRGVRWSTYGVMLLAIIVVMWARSFWSMIFMLILMQIGLVLLLIIRRELDEAASRKEAANVNHVTRRSHFFKRIKFIILHDERPSYVRGFMLISIVAVSFYIAAIVSIRFAVFIGPFPFMLLAFGVLLGFGNILSFISVLTRFNFHLVLFLIALVFGHFFDSHKLHLPEKQSYQPQFSQRQNLRDYFINWVNDPSRKPLLNGTDSLKYPVYFVMANGGASRSGYWTAKILGSLEDTTAGKFSQHLFCLSGASGGSVGNATFFSLLRAKDSLNKYHRSLSKTGTEYLRSDFLTFTLSHLLGPDIFRNFLPFLNLFEMDRGRALAFALEEAPSPECFLYDSFKVRLSSLITQKNNPDYKLPIFCINTTRMTDGNPAVISNIRIRADDIRYNYFNNRVDVLDLLGEEKDMKLSTAVVLGASFPYISPAGRIDKKVRLVNDSTHEALIVYEPYYFVDGGYFDNSGAGVINEMITGMNNLMLTDPLLKPYKDKLEFFVIHISNTDPREIKKDPLNSMTNDLLAPAKTLLGSYGTQTTVNDQRLKSYLYNIYGNQDHYNQIDLYDKSTPKFKFSMNWVISDKHRYRMDSALLGNDAYKKEMGRMLKWQN